MTRDPICTLYDLFADLLEYPNAAAPQKTGLCLEQLQAIQPEAAVLFESFHSSMQRQALEQIQELYTTTFDMQPVCYPYIGYQLFGESYKRGTFMAQINEAYRAAGFSAGNELPDHVSIALHFLALDAARREDEFGRVLLCEGVEPAVKKMIEILAKQADNPYTGVLSALLLVLSTEKEVDHA